MKKYLEIKKTQVITNEDEQKIFARVEIATDGSDETTKLKDLEDFATKEGIKAYKIERHTHYHAEGKPCVRELVKEIKETTKKVI